MDEVFEEKQRVMVTGAAGFVGGCLVRALTLHEAYIPISVFRSEGDLQLISNNVYAANVSPETDWAVALAGVSIVVHAAARVHVMNESSATALDEYRRVNFHGTLKLARQAAEAGVRRFVFISSIKVNGEATSLARPYCADDPVNPVDPYGVSKHEAEVALRQLALKTGMEVVIIRPTLVYGPGVKANFEAMLAWVKRGVPLPLGAINNKRSLVFIENLIDLVILSMHHESAANQTFLVSDDEDLSTSELLAKAANALGVKSRVFPFPSSMLRLFLTLLGRKAISQRLCGSLQVDISKTCLLLGWRPAVNVNEALKRTAAVFVEKSV